MNVKLAPPDAGAILMDEKVLAEQIARIGQRHPRTAQEVIFLNGREIFSMARDPSWRKKFGEAYDIVTEPESFCAFYNSCWDTGQYEGHTRFPLTPQQVLFLSRRNRNENDVDDRILFQPPTCRS